MKYTLDTCPDKARHTNAPQDYLGWRAWAEKKSKTHRQERCPTCGLWAIWKPKPATRADGSLSALNGCAADSGGGGGLGDA